jgi:uncharacterized GH25 family protein
MRIWLLIFAAACAQSVHAHDLWLIPPQTAHANKSVTIRANVGMQFPNSEHAPDTTAFPKRLCMGPDGKPVDLSPSGQSDLSGLLQFKPGIAGIYVIGVETKPQLISLDADAFNSYLVSDGLPHIYQLRFKEKTLNQAATERYQKSPKAIIKIGNGVGDPLKPLGLFLEIIPLDNPFAIKVGQTLRVRVDFQGRPLTDAQLGWAHEGDGDPTGTIRTDRRGQALIPIARTGLMTIRLTHMARPKNPDFEWESFWTTLTFRVPE